MSITGGIVLYATLWFLCLFLMLPIGHRSQDDAGDIVPGTHAGAPSGVNWRRKLIWTTAITSAIWAVLALLAARLGVAASTLELVAGAGARWKRVAVAGDPAWLETRAEALLRARGSD